MADIALQTQAAADGLISVVQSVMQETNYANEALAAAGVAVRFDTTSGMFAKGNATTEAESKVWGIALNKAGIRRAVTVIRYGIVDGFDLSALDYGAPIYLSDTDGLLADASGTVDVLIGHVMPRTGVPLGTAFDKVLFVDCTGHDASALDIMTFSDDLMAASVDEWVWVAPRACVLTGIDEIHSVIGGSGAVVTPRKVTAAGTAAPGDAAGATVKELTTAAIGLETTINVSQAPTLTATLADRVFAAGDKLAHNFAGTLTGLVGKVTYTFKAL